MLKVMLKIRIENLEKWDNNFQITVFGEKNIALNTTIKS